MATVWDKLRANKTRWAAKEAKAAVSTPVSTPISAPVVKDPVVLNSGGDSSTSAPYWKKVGGTYTQTRPSLMNKTEFYFYKRKQAGLSADPAPASYAEDKVVMDTHFGKDYTAIKQPTPTAAEIRESGDESHAVFVARNESRSASVDADEYIKHHASNFGSGEAESLGAGLHNLYSDSYSVVTPSKGVNVVVDSEKDTMTVISDRALSQKERQDLSKTADMAGDTPNQVTFIDNSGSAGGGAPVVSSGGGGAKVVSGGMIAVIAGIAIVWYLMSRRR